MEYGTLPLSFNSLCLGIQSCPSLKVKPGVDTVMWCQVITSDPLSHRDPQGRSDNTEIHRDGIDAAIDAGSVYHLNVGQPQPVPMVWRLPVEKATGHGYDPSLVGALDENTWVNLEIIFFFTDEPSHLCKRHKE